MSVYWRQSSRSSKVISTSGLPTTQSSVSGPDTGPCESGRPGATTTTRPSAGTCRAKAGGRWSRSSGQWILPFPRVSRVITLAPRADVRPHVEDRLADGAPGMLVFRRDGGLVAARGMAIAIPDSSDVRFVALDADIPMPHGPSPETGPGEREIRNGLRIMYISRAAPSLAEHDFAEILATACEHNELNEITGALCLRAGFFAQILEGPEPAVRETYARIERDERHQEPVIVTEESTTRRLYAGWRMKGYDGESAMTAADELLAQKGLADRSDSAQLTRRWLALLGSQHGPTWRSEWLTAKQSVLLARELLVQSATPHRS